MIGAQPYVSFFYLHNILIAMYSWCSPNFDHLFREIDIMYAREEKKYERMPVITYTLHFDNEIYLSESESGCAGVYAIAIALYVDNLYVMLRLMLVCPCTHPIGALTRTSKWKRNFIYISADVCIYSQMIFIFISNTSIDIFCSFRVDFFSLFSLLFVVSLVIFMLLRFRAFLACGWFYSELMRRMRTNTNVLNCTMYVYIRTYNSHNDVAGVGVVSIIMFFFRIHPTFSISHCILFVEFSPYTHSFNRLWAPTTALPCSLSGGNGSTANKEEHVLTNIYIYATKWRKARPANDRK